MENILFGAWELFVWDEQTDDYKSLGALNTASLTINKDIKERVWDNKKLPPREVIKEIIFSANLYDINVDNIFYCLQIASKMKKKIEKN